LMRTGVPTCVLHSIKADVVICYYVDTGQQLVVSSNMTSKEELFTTAFNTVPFLIFQKDTKNNILCVNRAVADSFGIDQEELENTSSAQWFPDDVDIYYADDLEVINNNKPKLGIIEPKVICGETRWWTLHKLSKYC